MTDTISDRIRETRQRQGRSAHEVSVAAGLSKNTVWELETGPRRSPSVKNLQAIARALGVSDVWLMHGDRRNSAGTGFSESMAKPWAPPPPSGERPDRAFDHKAFLRALAPRARHASTFRLSVSLFDFGLIAGDVLIVDLNGKAVDGDIVLANVADLTTGNANTIVRRLFSPYLVSARLDEPDPVILADGTRTQIMGVVCASFRAPQIA